MENIEILNDFVKSRNLNKSTKRSYQSSFKCFTEFTGMTLQELLDEAEAEEVAGIRWKDRKLKRRLVDYRNFLFENFLENTAKTYFGHVKTLYNHYEIEIHILPPLNTKNTNKSVPLSYRDLPTKDIISKAIDISKPVMRAIILFMSSSGCSKRETLNITIDQFLKATYEYHNSTDINEAIRRMDNENDIIPTWQLKRHKTNKYYITFSSPESTKAIIDYLIGSKRKLDLKDNLFKFNSLYLNNSFIYINSSLDLGKAGTYNRFRPHILRKFHASQLYNDGMPMEYVDHLQGRSKGKTQSSYFMEDPEKLKQMYKEHMHAILIKTEVNKLDVKSKEYKDLEKKNDEYLDIINNRLAALEQAKNEPMMYGTNQYGETRRV